MAVLRRMAAVLAAVWLYFYPAAGCVMVGISLLICCLRVLTGVHYPSDVLAGLAFGGIAAVLGLALPVFWPVTRNEEPNG